MVEKVHSVHQDDTQLKTLMKTLGEDLVETKKETIVSNDIQLRTYQMLRALGQYILDVHRSDQNHRPPFPENFEDLFASTFPPKPIATSTTLD